MPGVTLSEAERRLREHGAYDWLLDSQQVWSVAEFMKGHATGVGVTLSHDAVTRWFKACPHTMNYGGPIGLRATRDDLVCFLAGRMRVDRFDPVDQEGEGRSINHPAQPAQRQMGERERESQGSSEGE